MNHADEESISSSIELNSNKSDRPLLKKSRTIATDDDNRTTHFPGPLFPAVRRVSTSPPSTELSLHTSSSYVPADPAPAPVETGGTGFSDRDWMYPSFLGGPYAARKRVTVRTSRSQNHESPSPTPVRSDVTTTSYDSGCELKSNSLQGIVGDQDLISSEVKPKSKQKLKQSPALVSIPSTGFSSLTMSAPSNRNTGASYTSRISYLVKFSYILLLAYANFLRMEVARLKEENTSLHGWCNNNTGESDNHLPSPFGDSHSRSFALYAVMLTLITPFILSVCLNYVPRIKDLPKRETHKNEEAPMKKRIAYILDVCFSRYPYAKLLALLSATIFLIVFGGMALYAVSDSGFTEALWLSWTFVADSGNHADTVGVGTRIVSVSVTAGGMLIFATMLGLVSDAISEKVDSLRKGKSEVIECNHILILGWSDKLGSLLKQLSIANKSIGGGVVVVLAERDKEEMEIDIAKLEFDFMGTSVICRSGSPLILADLKKVSVSKARAIIVLASDENADQSDARALRVVLSLTGVKEGLKGHVVVEMSDLDNEPLVKLVGGELIETVVAHDVIGRLMIQCALQPGLAQIWEDILGFENAEFYIKRWPQLDGLHFEDVLVSFPDAVPCGVKIAEDGGKIVINPDDKYVLKEGDEVLVIAEDDDTYAPVPLPEVRRNPFPRVSEPRKYPEKILFCGWRRDIDDMIMVLEALLAPGSELWMFNDVPEEERERKLTDGGLNIFELVNIKLVHHKGNAVIRRHLENLPLESFDSILILADEAVEDSVVHSDSRSLATLLLIRDIQSKRLPYKDTNSVPVRHCGFSHSTWIREMQRASNKSIIISEILDSRTRNLVSVSRIGDYVLSNELVSMALAMVAEDKQINRVLEELFAEEGNELCIKPAEFYLYDQEELCFYDIMVRGRQRNEIVIGYRLANTENAIINPENKINPRKWSLDDVFVIISSEK
ncbi:probable ion channel POLLUX [Impatiens glandulifera]|uniref:probable ion channel POLLUX n=1 Tax=Impatiens glandulifera TaxID=253017 RepID=UPI001FB0E67A|nr:probable ion channel POLLUX [Impatiens glandulifera]